MKKKERKRMHLKEMWEDFSYYLPLCIYFLCGGLLSVGIGLGISLSPWFFFLCAPAVIVAVVFAIVKIFENYYY